MALSAADPIGSENNSFRFELDRFELDGDQGLELRGRWFGVRGRRFVRPTLTMRIDGARHRLLADLEHKPWTANEGEEWVAAFSSVPPAGEANEIKLTVAPDIAILLSPPGYRAPSATINRSVNGAGTSPPPVSARKVLEQERAKARDLSRKLKQAEANHARLAAERDALIAEREVLVAERDSTRRDQALSRERVADLQDRLKASKAAHAGVSEADERLEAERALTNRLRSALEEHEAVVAERDRLACELKSALAEQGRLTAQASQPRTVASEARPVPRGVPARRSSRAALDRRRGEAWAVRALALIALASVLITLLIVLHLP